MHGIIFLLVLVITTKLTEEIGYNCSDFDGRYEDHTLVECPPAKFMLKDNLVECFDNFTKHRYENEGYRFQIFFDFPKLFNSTI